MIPLRILRTVIYQLWLPKANFCRKIFWVPTKSGGTFPQKSTVLFQSPDWTSSTAHSLYSHQVESQITIGLFQPLCLKSWICRFQFVWHKVGSRFSIQSNFQDFPFSFHVFAWLGLFTPPIFTLCKEAVPLSVCSVNLRHPVNFSLHFAHFSFRVNQLFDSKGHMRWNWRFRRFSRSRGRWSWWLFHR